MTTAAFDAEVWLTALPVLLTLALLGWLVSLAVKSVNLAGTLWCVMLFAAAVTYALDSDPRAPRLPVVLWLLALWAARLTAYLVTRNAGKGEERQCHARDDLLNPRVTAGAEQGGSPVGDRHGR